MHKFLTVFTLFIIISIVSSCSSTTKLSSADEGEVPDWFLTTPEEKDFLFAANSATSQDMQIAVDKATADARVEIGRQVEVRLQGLQKNFAEEVGVGEDQRLLQQFTEASKTVVSTNISGTQPVKKEIVRDGNFWRSYVLLKYPIGSAQDEFLRQIKKNDELYTRIKSTEAFKELEVEVEKYDSSKNK